MSTCGKGPVKRTNKYANVANIGKVLFTRVIGYFLVVLAGIPKMIARKLNREDILTPLTAYHKQPP